MTDQQVETFQYSCSQCGTKASEGDSWEHAKTLAVAEGVQFRHVVAGFKVVCEECGSAKQMRATDIEAYEKQGIEKV